MGLFNFKFSEETSLSFWEHLEELRWTIIRIIIVLVVSVIVLFGFKDFLFDQIIFPPLSSDFIIYRQLCELSVLLNLPGLCPDNFRIELINFELTGQFMSHLSTTFTIALILAMPYLLYEIWNFIAPALYANEKRSIGWVFFSSSLLFYIGATVSYYVIFPLSIRFLGTYQISTLVPNQISVQSYLGTLFLLVFAMGIMFEMPVLAFLLSKLGIITRETLRAGRNIAILVILILSALITPTTDPFTMLLVALPLYTLYEISILVCKRRKIEIDENAI